MMYKMKILVIDDDRMLCNDTTPLLEKEARLVSVESVQLEENIKNSTNLKP